MEIANVPPIVEDVSNLNNKETTQSNSNVADINPNEVIPSNVEEEEYGKSKSTMWQVKMQISTPTPM